jgi:2-polyprenyl-3-methyl-5-hydroxy-6-metoxy-1,4-benzoquinol methylase
MPDLNPQAKQMADESMVRNLYAQARAIWPQESLLFKRYELPAEPRILDAGCGTGEITSRLAELYPSARVLGVDIIDKHLELARSRYANLKPRLAFERQSIFELDAADDTFDLTVCRPLPCSDKSFRRETGMVWWLFPVAEQKSAYRVEYAVR